MLLKKIRMKSFADDVVYIADVVSNITDAVNNIADVVGNRKEWLKKPIT